VQNTIDFLRNKNIAIRILTNDASRSQHQQKESFEKIGLFGIETHEIITSGMMARQYLQQKYLKEKLPTWERKIPLNTFYNQGLNTYPFLRFK